MWLDDCDPELALHHSKTLGYRQCAVERGIQLPQRCADDFSMPCNRFFDVLPLLYLGSNPLKGSSFVGCMRNLNVNSHLIHFSNFERLEKVGDVQAGCRRFRPDSCRLENDCPLGAKCVDVWDGRMCQCPNKVHSHKPCNLGEH
jgi:hypothetical protein